MKRILTVQDISCVGKCSLTVALPVLSAMGVETAVLPTAVLSTHTAFPSPVRCDLTAQLASIADHWQHIGARFDAIYTGYLSSAEQVDAVRMLAQRFSPELLLIDPVMGDNGRLYSGFDDTFVQKMKTLCAKADVIVPNVTEACLLTDTPYPQAPETDFFNCLLEKLSKLCAGSILITGAACEPGKTGVIGRTKTGEVFSCFREKLPQSYHGTGDIFASSCAGALLLGMDLPAASALAADFTAECIRCTMELDRDPRYGVCFEKALPYLWQQL